MKITIVQGPFFPVPTAFGGATEKKWFMLGKEFAKKGHEVIHISRAFKDFKSEEIIDDVNLELKRIGMNFKWENKLKDPFGLEDKDSWIKIFLED